MKTIIKKLLAHYWLVYPVLILRCLYIIGRRSGWICFSIYDVPLLSLLFLLCVFEAFLLKKVNPDDMDFILYTH